MIRALRRHHRERLKIKRNHYWGRDLRNDPKILAKTVNTPTPCSCWMCCNRRSIEGDTLQELAAKCDVEE